MGYACGRVLMRCAQRNLEIGDNSGYSMLFAVVLLSELQADDLQPEHFQDLLQIRRLYQLQGFGLDEQWRPVCYADQMALSNRLADLCRRVAGKK